MAIQTTLTLLAGFAILAYALTKAPKQRQPSWSQHLSGSQKLFGVIALFLVLLMAMNPEFLALGIFGDAAFFDIMVLALSLQMHMIVKRVCRGYVTALARAIRWALIPGPGDLYMLDAFERGGAKAVSAFKKAFGSHAPS